jgi:FkbM family methyltransferase
MLIPADDIKKKYSLKMETILHVGAHAGEEKEIYMRLGAEKIIWVEGSSHFCDSLKENIADEHNIVVNAVVSDRDNESVVFNIANNGQSSSLLELGIHKHLFQDIAYVQSEIHTTRTLESILTQQKISPSELDFINLDIQGAELMALQGLGEKFLNTVPAIYTEINTDYVYKNCALVGEIDDFLETYGFHRFETQMWGDHPWGDALYLRC